jgi:hypothetical protein
MSRLTFYRGTLLNLAGTIPEGTRQYIPKEAAYELLKKTTGMDFGYDVEKWSHWLKSTGEYWKMKKLKESRKIKD